MCNPSNFTGGGGAGGADELEVEIMPDGTIKTSAGKVSAANHGNAEQFLAYLARLTGGQVKRERKHGAGAHTHATEQNKATQ